MKADWVLGEKMNNHLYPKVKFLRLFSDIRSVICCIFSSIRCISAETKNSKSKKHIFKYQILIFL